MSEDGPPAISAGGANAPNSLSSLSDRSSVVAESIDGAVGGGYANTTARGSPIFLWKVPAMTQQRVDAIDRRHFLQAGAVAALGLAGGPGLRAADDTKKGPFGGFTLGVQSFTFREFDTEQALKRTQDLGLHYAELYQK